MSSHWPRTLLAMFTLCLVLLLVLADLDNAAPGPLSATHEQVEELQGREGCASCHGSSEDALRLACLECHEPIREQLAGNSGLHGQLEQRDECGRCHREHVSDETPLVSPLAFAFAGIPERDAYDHAGLNFDLYGAHADLSCDSCHANADATLLAAGTTRFLGLTQSCASCHESPHGAEMGSNCIDCHSQDTPFDLVENYEHDPMFPLIGAHDGIGCYDCHQSGTQFSVELSRTNRPSAVRNCAECHGDSHSPSFLTVASAEAQVETNSSCTICHTSLVGGFTAAGSLMTKERHTASGFALAAPHDDVSCDACHDPLLDRASRFPGRDANDCRACHEDPHAGQFTHPADRARACLDCHAKESFTPHHFDDSLHATTAFPLDGAHSDVACDDCHRPEEITGVLRFRPTASGCADCHDDVHGGAFLPAPGDPGGPGSIADLIRSTDCSTCHQTTHFADLIPGAFDHGASTGFALVGIHKRAECTVCHVPNDAASALGRQLGLVADAFPGPAGRCDTCHADVHDGRFALEPESGTRTDCVHCHSQEDFSALRSGAFEHGAWTGFELRGAHSSAECATCHRTTEQIDERGRSFGHVAAVFPGDTNRCDTCHADVHDGLLSHEPGSGERTDCSSCHGEVAFSPQLEGGFDHELWTRFPLEGVHAEAACAACHPACRPDAHGRTFGRALGVNCTDCHRDPHLGQFRAEGRNDCARCHSSDESFARTLFDHGRDSAFALDATHSKLECSACHQKWTTSNGTKAVRYRPLAHECADCHLPGTKGGR